MEALVAQARFNWFWLIVVLFLLAVIIITSFVAWTRYRPSKPAEIILRPEQELSGNVIIAGAVTNPGIYPYSISDSVGSLIHSAGGVTDNGNSGSLTLTVPQINTGEAAQKIDINHAEAWLLEALPGIGPTRAKAITDYRQKNGFFHNINELTKVEGISLTLFEQIRPLITISD